MRTILVGLVVVTAALIAGGFVAARDGGKDAARKKDRQLYKGVWRVVTLVVDGKVVENADKKFSVVNGSDGAWSIRDNDNEISKGDSQIDPTQTPKTIDFTPSEGAGVGKSFVGIYEIGEKTRKLCFVESGAARPTEFVSAPGSKSVCATFERVKVE